MSWVELQTGGRDSRIIFLSVFLIVLPIYVTLELERCVYYLQPGLKK